MSNPRIPQPAESGKDRTPQQTLEFIAGLAAEGHAALAKYFDAVATDLSEPEARQERDELQHLFLALADLRIIGEETAKALDTPALASRVEAMRLIERSISHTETVSADYACELNEALLGLGDDFAVSDGTHEHWGTHEGNAWRVHLHRLVQS